MEFSCQSTMLKTSYGSRMTVGGWGLLLSLGSPLEGTKMMCSPSWTRWVKLLVNLEDYFCFSCLLCKYCYFSYFCFYILATLSTFGWLLLPIKFTTIGQELHRARRVSAQDRPVRALYEEDVRHSRQHLPGVLWAGTLQDHEITIKWISDVTKKSQFN